MFALCVRMLLRFCSIYFKTPLTVLERIRCLVGGSVYLTSSSNSWTKGNKLLSNSDSSTFINYQGVHRLVTNLNNLIYIYIYIYLKDVLGNHVFEPMTVFKRIKALTIDFSTALLPKETNTKALDLSTGYHGSMLRNPRLKCGLDSRFAFSSSFFFFFFFKTAVVNFSSIYNAHFSNTNRSHALFTGPTNFTFQQLFH